jgi:error-prone DNA polymerase
MTHKSSVKEMESLRKDFISGAIKKGVTEEIADGGFSRLSSFAYYGFNKAHAAAFARISYESAYLKAHYPAHYLASILNCEPMGFFPAWVILNEARRMGVRILPPDINESSTLFSAVDNTIRVGLMQVAEIGPALLVKIESEKAKRCFDSIDDFKNRIKPPVQALENLIKIGAFDSFHPNRRNLLRTIFTSDLTTNSKFLSDSFTSRERIVPADYSLIDKVAMESRILGMNISAHPISPARIRLRSIGVSTASGLESKQDGARVRVAGIVVHRSSLRAKNGRHVLFLTLEDETGIADLTVFSNVLARSRQACHRSPAITATGKIRKRGKTGFSIIAESIESLDLH